MARVHDNKYFGLSRDTSSFKFAKISYNSSRSIASKLDISTNSQTSMPDAIYNGSEGKVKSLSK